MPANLEPMEMPSPDEVVKPLWIGKTRVGRS